MLGPTGTLHSSYLGLGQAHPHGFWPLSTRYDIDDDRLPFAEPLDARSLKSRDVDKHILPAATRSDETVALLDVEPLHRAGLFDRRVRGWSVRGRRPKIRSPSCRWSGGARIDAQHLGDVRSIVAGTNTDFEGFSLLNGCSAALGQHASMQEGLT